MEDLLLGMEPRDGQRSSGDSHEQDRNFPCELARKKSYPMPIYSTTSYVDTMCQACSRH